MKPLLFALGLLAGTAQAADTYRNPVLPGFHADPSICRVGNDYYLATSSFEYFPGVPIFHSKDLVHWKQIGHALTRTSQLPLAGQRYSRGIFAPTLRCNETGFWMITTNVDNGGNFYVHAKDPAGPWSEPVWIKEQQGWIDPSLFFDDDGTVYFTRHDGGEKGGVAQARIDLKTGKLLDAPKRIWNGTGGVWPEGPHLYKINGMYYLMIAEGGTSYNHAITVARSKSPFGPFESNPANPILTHRGKPEQPLQALGHADLVQTPDGKWWMVLLGVRPQQNKHHLGRETMLAPVTWKDGWPVVNDGKPLTVEMSGAGLPPAAPWPAEPVRTGFDAPQLDLRWTFLRGPTDGLYSLTERPGWLRLKGNRWTMDDAATPAFVARRQQHLNMRAAMLVDFAPGGPGQYAGLALRQNENNHYQLRIGGSAAARRVELVTRVKGVTTAVASTALATGPVELQVRAWPDRYEFSYAQQGGKPVVLGSAPTAPLSSEEAGGFTGVFVGMFATGAPADVDWFDYEPLGD
ncbi:alpha-N-arabinofuranosidase [Pseudoduganella flava]|uniref:Alpha-N-arabinofuranosidase n=1 Tax=Pseudoduganella flava TaxID=871742 RepID=A0A562Q4S8_9BURK|nr:glycoside hydrolase family 43 protein [Pseudoduganella flava]QGZ41732.1 family 43 glycosylhydrolase [Pseudoduganella flava]TWI51732.1 alpha-N-arabinofuranosidase [Pseudoduganella flava]